MTCWGGKLRVERAAMRWSGSWTVRGDMGSVVIVTSLIIEEGTKSDRCVLTIGSLW